LRLIVNAFSLQLQWADVCECVGEEASVKQNQTKSNCVYIALSHVWLCRNNCFCFWLCL